MGRPTWCTGAANLITYVVLVLWQRYVTDCLQSRAAVVLQPALHFMGQIEAEIPCLTLLGAAALPRREAAALRTPGAGAAPPPPRGGGHNVRQLQIEIPATSGSMDGRLPACKVLRNGKTHNPAQHPSP